MELRLEPLRPKSDPRKPTGALRVEYRTVTAALGRSTWTSTMPSNSSLLVDLAWK